MPYLFAEWEFPMGTRQTNEPTEGAQNMLDIDPFEESLNRCLQDLAGV
jgi:hypothetical protein